MKKIVIIAATIALGLPMAGSALAQGNSAATAHPATQRCRDAHGHFTRCPPAAAHATGPSAGVTRDSHGRCHGANGRFVACPH